MIRRLLRCRDTVHRTLPFPECCDIPDHNLRFFRCTRWRWHRGQHEHELYAVLTSDGPVANRKGRLYAVPATGKH